MRRFKYIFLAVLLSLPLIRQLNRNQQEKGEYTPKATEKILPVERIWQRLPGIERPQSVADQRPGR